MRSRGPHIGADFNRGGKSDPTQIHEERETAEGREGLEGDSGRPSFWHHIKGIWEVVGLGAGGQLACLSPDLPLLPQTLWPEAGLWVFPVAVQVHEGVSVYR